MKELKGWKRCMHIYPCTRNLSLPFNFAGLWTQFYNVKAFCSCEDRAQGLYIFYKIQYMYIRIWCVREYRDSLFPIIFFFFILYFSFSQYYFAEHFICCEIFKWKGYFLRLEYRCTNEFQNLVPWIYIFCYIFLISSVILFSLSISSSLGWIHSWLKYKMMYFGVSIIYICAQYFHIYRGKSTSDLRVVSLSSRPKISLQIFNACFLQTTNAQLTSFSRNNQYHVYIYMNVRIDIGIFISEEN